MADDDTKTVTLMFLKEQVLRWAAPIIHRHKCQDIEDIENNYAPINHASTSDIYGVGDNSKYGHLQLADAIGDANDNDKPVKISGIIAYVGNQISNLEDRLRNDLQAKLTIKNVVNSSSTDGQIPTAKAVWDAITNYKELFVGVSLDKPKHINAHLDTMREPGYYMQTGTRYFSYGGEAIYYTNALVKVERQANRVIQHVYATSKITSNGTTNYKINGSEYTRWGLSENNWKPWHVAHKPYTKTTRACNEGRGVDVGSVVVYENTSGFIVHWDQFEQENDKYPVSAPLYSWATVCEFSPALPIKGPYVFGNLIGRCDFKITSNKLQIRSNVSPGGRIIEMHETFFVPRNQ